MSVGRLEVVGIERGEVGHDFACGGCDFRMDGMAKSKTLRCPTCRTIVLPKGEDFPFCSDRCRLIDLGKWASGGYVISSPIHDPELLDELEGLRDRQQKTRTDED